MEKVATPGCDSIDKLAEFLQVPATRIVKSVLYIVDEKKKVLVLIRADKEVNEVKLTHLLDCDSLRVAETSDLEELTGAGKGGVGPVNADWADEIVADKTVKGLYNVVVGAGESDAQFINANLDRDFKADRFADLRVANEGEPDPVDHEPLKFTTSIELVISSSWGPLHGNHGGQVPGPERQVPASHHGLIRDWGYPPASAVVEQHATENGVAWPKEIAPFGIHIIQMKMKDEIQSKLAEDLEAKFAKYDVLYDDRNERPGVKFNDADLVGAPIRITVGRDAADGIVEVKRPGDDQTQKLAVADLEDFIANELD